MCYARAQPRRPENAARTVGKQHYRRPVRLLRTPGNSATSVHAAAGQHRPMPVCHAHWAVLEAASLCAASAPGSRRDRRAGWGAGITARSRICRRRIRRWPDTARGPPSTLCRALAHSQFGGVNRVDAERVDATLPVELPPDPAPPVRPCATGEVAIWGCAPASFGRLIWAVASTIRPLANGFPLHCARVSGNRPPRLPVAIREHAICSRP